MKPQFNTPTFAAGLATGAFFLVCPTEEPAVSMFMSFIAFAASISEIIHYKKEVKKYNFEVENGHKKD